MIATVDAESGMLIALEDRTVWSGCSPNSNDQDSAVGIPQNENDINPRSIWATETDDRGANYTHEAHKISSGTNPDIQVFFGIEDDPCTDEDYSLMPIKTISGSPKYEDYDTPDSIPGSAGADAMYFTYKTMATFDAYGRDGWDDDGTVARVVVDAFCPSGREDNATFAYPGGADFVPAEAVATCTAEDEDFSPAAAIDVVAHEWGHGVVFTSAGWSYSGDGEIYHEAFADVIGHAVEWQNQTSGAGAERAEWKFGEDRDDSQETWWRRPDVDDGALGFKYHESDTAGTGPDEAYYEALPLSVAFFLMADGHQDPDDDNDHKNPWCVTDPENDDCDVTVTDIGANKASRILFKMLTDYALSSSGWEDFGQLAKAAAFALYNNCPSSNAQSEQESADEAFEAIGYPATYSWLYPCVSPP